MQLTLVVFDRLHTVGRGFEFGFQHWTKVDGLADQTVEQQSPRLCQRTVKRDRVGSKVVPFGWFEIRHLKEPLGLVGMPVSGQIRRHYGEYP